MRWVHKLVWKYKGNDKEYELYFENEESLREYLHIICNNSNKEIVEFYPVEVK